MISHEINNSNTIPLPDDSEALRKHYETMSYGEMSQRLADNYKELSEILGNRISLPTTDHSEDDEESEDDTEMTNIDILNSDLDLEQKKSRLTKLFLKTISSGDVEKVNSYLLNDAMKQCIDMNGKDEDGTTPLIYAACFGKFEIAQALLLAGAEIDNQDSRK